VKVLTGNTDNVRYSIGTFASRAGIVTGSAVLIAARQLKQRALEIGGTLLQSPVDELILLDGAVRKKSDPSRSVALSEIVHLSRGEAGAPLPLRQFGPGMSTVASFCPPTNTFATGCHCAVVEVDPKTCKVKILNYVAVEDFGTLINPLIVDGQVIGGVSLGIGNTFLEKVVYDESGQILTGTFTDYLMATTVDVPRIEIDYVVTPTPLNPLGMKGAGQGGTIPVPAVLTAAVEDALEPFGVHLRHVPFSESDLFASLQQARALQAEVRQ
jgi:CO/xanthine dehydrogenase Mo-binding subunit